MNLGTGIRHAVGKVELRRMSPTLSVGGKCSYGSRCDFLIDRDDLDLCFSEKRLIRLSTATGSTSKFVARRIEASRITRPDVKRAGEFSICSA